MIKVENITVTAGSRKILEEVSCVFEPGKMNLIIGPNGAGKSTLIKVLSRQIKPTSGNVFYEARELRTLSNEYLSKIRSVLSQNVEMAFPLTVSEVVMMGRYPHFISRPGKHDEQAVEEAMRFFDVSELAGRSYMTLSGGEKQRVHFARVMSQIWYPVAGESRFLMLDEPLTFLDVHYQFQFMHQLITLLKDTELVVIGVVHDLNLASRFADRILLLSGGKVLASGTKENVLTKANVLSAFQLEPVIYRDEASKSIHLFFN